MKKWIFVIVIMSFFANSSYAQRLRTIRGSYKYVVPNNVTIDVAKSTAIERAKIDALANEFGTQVSQINSISISTTNENTNSQFLSVGGSDVNGEWVEDTTPPSIAIDTEDGLIVISAKVHGKAREISKKKIDISAKVLRNGKDDKFEDDRFVNGDDIYLLFQSPVNGYLAVYLSDKSDIVYCLLPYSRSSSNDFPIEKGKQNLLFSINEAANSSEVDEYQLVCDNDGEYNRLYIIFSPNSFYKANDNTSGENLPRALSYEAFNTWLSKTRIADTEMQVINKVIHITK